MQSTYEDSEYTNIQSDSEKASLIQQPMQGSYQQSSLIQQPMQGSIQQSKTSFTNASGLSPQIKLLVGLLALICLLLCWIAVALTVTFTTLSSDKFVENAISSGISSGVTNAVRFQSISYYINELLSYPIFQLPLVVGSVLQFNYGEAATNVDNLLTGKVIKSVLGSLGKPCTNYDDSDGCAVFHDVSDSVNALASVMAIAKQINPNKNKVGSAPGNANGDTTDIITDIVSYLDSQLDSSKWSSLAGPCAKLYDQIAAVNPLSGSYESTCGDNTCNCLIGSDPNSDCENLGSPCNCEWSIDNEMRTTILPTVSSVCDALKSIPDQDSSVNRE